jgi:uncharacterized surface protein with fasciclin (FAS1) repeats/cyclophilin family peptidyl-prolyl cis-trans isomerase
VVEDFMAQFGISGDPAIASTWSSLTLDDDPVIASNTRGTLSFATAGPNTRTTQMFINLVDNSFLDDSGFAPFGIVYEADAGGMDAVDALYAAYGDGPPNGNGPDQGRIQEEGNEYLMNEFPLLSYIESVRRIPSPQFVDTGDDTWDDDGATPEDDTDAAFENNTITADVTDSTAEEGDSVEDGYDNDVTNVTATLEEGGCTICDFGSIDSELQLADGLSCGDQFSVVADSGTESCLYDRLVATGRCGCPVGEEYTNQFCNVCNGSVIDSVDLIADLEYGKYIPDAASLTCEELFALSAIDGSDSCNLLFEKYAHFCGCPDILPSCSLCQESPTIGEQQYNQDKIIPLQFVPWDNDGFPEQTTCSGINLILSVQTSSVCPEFRSSWLASSPLDIISYCECPETQAPKLCGDYCPSGMRVTNKTKDLVIIFPDRTSYTCAQIELGVHYTTDVNTCQEFQQQGQETCCAVASIEDESSSSTRTVLDILSQTEETTEFFIAIVSVNVHRVLEKPNVVFTVLVPTNEAMTDELIQFYSVNLLSWYLHLTSALENHIVEGSSLTLEELWSSGESLMTLAGETLEIDGMAQTVGGQSLVPPEAIAANGIIHTVGGVLFPRWNALPILDLLRDGRYFDDLQRRQRRLQEENQDKFNSLLVLMESADLISDERLLGETPNGTTLIAPSNVAFEDVGELGNVRDILLYHILDFNAYQEAFGQGQKLLLETGHPSANVWATVDQNGVLRYNDVIVQGQFFARNG